MCVWVLFWHRFFPWNTKVETQSWPDTCSTGKWTLDICEWPTINHENLACLLSLISLNSSISLLWTHANSLSSSSSSSSAHSVHHTPGNLPRGGGLVGAGVKHVGPSLPLARTSNTSYSNNFNLQRAEGNVNAVFVLTGLSSNNERRGENNHKRSVGWLSKRWEGLCVYI